MSTRRIVTDYVRPPVPTNRWDWCAYIDGTEEDGPYGYGQTEAEAIDDLESQLSMQDDEEAES